GDGYDDVIVGADGSDTAYLFLGGATGLNASPAGTLLGPDGSGNHFGLLVASVGDVDGDGFADVIVGASLAANMTGHAFVYRGGPTGLASTPAAMLAGVVAQGYFGVAAAGVGDVNGDGRADFAVLGGGIFVYLGVASHVPTTPATVITAADPISMASAPP